MSAARIIPLQWTGLNAEKGYGDASSSFIDARPADEAIPVCPAWAAAWRYKFPYKSLKKIKEKRDVQLVI